MGRKHDFVQAAMIKINTNVAFLLSLVAIHFILFLFLASTVRLNGNENKYGLPAFANEMVTIESTGTAKTEYTIKPLAVAFLCSVSFVGGMLSVKWVRRRKEVRGGPVA